MSTDFTDGAMIHGRLSDIADQLRRIADALERAVPTEQELEDRQFDRSWEAAYAWEQRAARGSVHPVNAIGGRLTVTKADRPKEVTA